MSISPPPPRRFVLTRGWHGLRPRTRRTIRQTAVVLATGVVALLIGIFTATAQGSVGPHEAELSVTATHEVAVDLGPLGSLLIDSPAPWPLGVQIDVGEIPATLTEVDNPLDALGGDVNAYAAFFSQPQAAVTAALWGLVMDAVFRAVLLWSFALVLIAAGQLAAGGLLRTELREKLRRHGVLPLAAVTVLAIVVVPVVGVLERPAERGRPSTVLAELSPLMSSARVTGRLAALIDTYGERAVAAVRSNGEYYDVVAANVADAYAQNSQPLAPRRALTPLVVEPPEDEETAGDDPSVEPTGESTDEVTSPDEPADETPSSDEDEVEEIEEVEPDIATIVLISDNHCNTGMGRVMGEVARQAQADLVLNLGDTTMGGSGPESLCVDAVASELTEFPVVVADGNHDSRITGEQERAHGWTVLDGGVVDVAGLRIVGDRDPRLTSVTLGEREYLTKAEAAEKVTTAACAGNDPDDRSSRVDILAIHDPYVGNRIMPSGCVVLELSGHLHRRVGPFQQGLGVYYGLASSGGATSGNLTLGELPATATIGVLLYDRANKRPTALREVRVDPDQSVTLTPWEAFPEPARIPVQADLSPTAAD